MSICHLLVIERIDHAGVMPFMSAFQIFPQYINRQYAPQFVEGMRLEGNWFNVRDLNFLESLSLVAGCAATCIEAVVARLEVSIKVTVQAALLDS